MFPRIVSTNSPSVRLHRIFQNGESQGNCGPLLLGGRVERRVCFCPQVPSEYGGVDGGDFPLSNAICHRRAFGTPGFAGPQRIFSVQPVTSVVDTCCIVAPRSRKRPGCREMVFGRGGLRDRPMTETRGLEADLKGVGGHGAVTRRGCPSEISGQKNLHLQWPTV